MPNISNEAVLGSGYTTYKNARPQRLSNGWFVTAHHSSSASKIQFRVKKTTAGAWEDLCFVNLQTGVNANFLSWSLASKGTSVYVTFASSALQVPQFSSFDALTVSPSLALTSVGLGSETTNGNFSGQDLTINDAGTELHAAWSSKNATYPNSFNIRYAKGVINGDGSVTWGAVVQVSKLNTSGQDIKNPSIAVKDNTPLITHEITVATDNQIVVAKETGLNTATAYNWTIKVIFNGGSYAQSNPSALFVPQSINGLANGRLWVAWHGKDATDSAKFNIRVSYSDDGGVTWATPVKLTSGNTFDRLNVSLSADKTGKVFALYEDHQWAPDIGIRMKTHNGSWGAEISVATADTAEQHPSALVDFTIQMTTPPFVYTDTTLGIRFTGNFNVGASVSPASGALGNKETTSLTTYTVTPEAGSTVTQIVERINGTIVNTFNNPASLSRTLTAPNATWDTLAYFASHTASITVTDSNGAQTVTTYSFDKTLATNASLLEATKANADAKNRISTKRDLLASQVGLSAGSTFDAIIGAFGSSVVKKQEGTFTTNGSGIATVTGLAFEPDLVFFMAVNGRSGHISKKYKAYQGIADGSNYGVVVAGTSAQTTSSSIVSNGFTVAGATANVTYAFVVYG